MKQNNATLKFTWKLSKFLLLLEIVISKHLPLVLCYFLHWNIHILQVWGCSFLRESCCVFSSEIIRAACSMPEFILCGSKLFTQFSILLKFAHSTIMYNMSILAKTNSYLEFDFVQFALRFLLGSFYAYCQKTKLHNTLHLVEVWTLQNCT